MLLDTLDIVLHVGLIDAGLEETFAVGDSPLGLLGNSRLLLLNLSDSRLHIGFRFAEKLVVVAHFLVEG